MREYTMRKYTVVGTYDNSGREYDIEAYVQHVEASGPRQAAQVAVKNAPSPITVVAVFLGHIYTAN